jgi:hypothetical protein
MIRLSPWTPPIGGSRRERSFHACYFCNGSPRLELYPPKDQNRVPIRVPPPATYVTGSLGGETNHTSFYIYSLPFYHIILSSYKNKEHVHQ